MLPALLPPSVLASALAFAPPRPVGSLVFGKGASHLGRTGTLMLSSADVYVCVGVTLVALFFALRLGAEMASTVVIARGLRVTNKILVPSHCYFSFRDPSRFLTPFDVCAFCFALGAGLYKCLTRSKSLIASLAFSRCSIDSRESS